MQIEFVGEKAIHISRGQTVLQASLQAGIPHFHACGGQGKCSTCRIMVLEGDENLSKLNKKEGLLRDSAKLTGSFRLACQTTVEREPVRVERIIKDFSDVAQYLDIDDQFPQKIKLKPLGEEKYLVLFFLDIRNFTPFVETYLPFDVIYITLKLFDIFHKVISRFNGQIIEAAGDELYAVFGRESSINQAANSAIDAAHTIQRELNILNKTYIKRYFRKEFEIGIGLHCGKVIVGEFRLGAQLKTSVMGLAVNIASRIQEQTKYLNNSFLASEELIKHSSFDGGTEDSLVYLKGVSRPYRLHLLGKSYREVI